MMDWMKSQHLNILRLLATILFCHRCLSLSLYSCLFSAWFSTSPTTAFFFLYFIKRFVYFFLSRCLLFSCTAPYMKAIVFEARSLVSAVFHVDCPFNVYCVSLAFLLYHYICTATFSLNSCKLHSFSRSVEKWKDESRLFCFFSSSFCFVVIVVEFVVSNVQL